MEKLREVETTRLQIDELWDEYLGPDPEEELIDPKTKFYHSAEAYRALVIERDEAIHKIDHQKREPHHGPRRGPTAGSDDGCINPRAAVPPGLGHEAVHPHSKLFTTGDARLGREVS